MNDDSSNGLITSDKKVLRFIHHENEVVINWLDLVISTGWRVVGERNIELAKESKAAREKQNKEIMDFLTNE